MSSKTQKATLIGGILASLAASICCIGPIIFAVLGVSSAGMISKFEAYRPLMIVVTIAFVAVAFYQTYKKKPAEECVEGSYCANPKSDKMNKVILWIASTLILGFITFPYWSIYLV